MKTMRLRRHQGQATTEFLAAAAVFVPLFFGIVYVGKISDIKHQAIQASRYAAMERALDPMTTPVNAAAENQATLARFFTDGSRNDGRITTADTTAGLETTDTTNPLWYEVNGQPLLSSYSDPQSGISVTVQSTSMDIGSFSAINQSTQIFDHINRNGQIEADVQVPIANITHLPAPLNALNLTVAATTVIAGDSWSGGGAQDVGTQQTTISDFGKNTVAKALGYFVQPWAGIFSDQPQGPQFGCVSPDVVPDAVAPGSNPPSGYECD